MTDEIDNLDLRPFQKRVVRNVLSGRNVVIQTPTGSGKTRAALAPFLINLMRPEGSGTTLPRTCRYAVPLRTLSNQFYTEHKGILHGLGTAGFTQIERDYSRYGLQLVTQQTGDHRDDPRFESVLTFCTIDQLMAAFLGIPYGVSKRDTNLKVAGVAGSYIVLDEWHLFPLRSADADAFDVRGARATSLAMLRMLKEQGLARFALMTATLSTELVDRLADLVGATVENLHQGPRMASESESEVFQRELQELNSNRERRWLYTGRILAESVEDILDRHIERRESRSGCASLLVCNTVERSQNVYLQLKQACRRRAVEPPAILLHSRFSSERRKQQADIVDRWLGEEAWDSGGHPDVIVVATQVVEVGLNISVDFLHTELAPASSLIQRAGRCARFAGQHGIVMVYELPKTRWPSAPYSAALCDCTRNVLPQTLMEVGFEEEQDYINQVHTPEDRLFLERFVQAEDGIVSSIFRGWSSGDELGRVAGLIRDVQQVSVIIHDNPDHIESDPLRYQAFSLHPGLLMGRMEWLYQKQRDLDLEWAIKEAELTPSQDSRGVVEEDSRAPFACTWRAVPETAHLRQLTGALVLAVPSSLAYYDDDIGFAFRDTSRIGELPATKYQSPEVRPAAARREVSYVIETRAYIEHVAGLVRAFQFILAGELRWPARQLEALLGFNDGSVEKIARLTLAYHDAGKLTEEWQGWARSWLTRLNEAHPSDTLPLPAELLAKTSFAYGPQSDHSELQVGLHRPNHAVEGAIIAARPLMLAMQSIAPRDAQQGNVLLRAALGAIAHHHTTDAFTARAVKLANGAAETLALACQAALGTAWVAELPPTTVRAHADARNYFAAMHASYQEGAWLYFLLVRALRLADKRADLGE